MLLLFLLLGTLLGYATPTPPGLVRDHTALPAYGSATCKKNDNIYTTSKRRRHVSIADLHGDWGQSDNSATRTLPTEYLLEDTGGVLRP